MKVLTVRQPYASAIIAGLKRWETRPLPPSGEMRPEGGRGLPGAALTRGERVWIHAAAARPQPGRYGPWVVEELRGARGRKVAVCWNTELDHDMVPPHPGCRALGHRWADHTPDLPTGVLLGSVTVADALPIRDSATPGEPSFVAMDTPLPAAWDEVGLGVDEAPPRRKLMLWADDGAGCVSEQDQMPWGWWKPGWWAWKLTDPTPVGDTCPRCGTVAGAPVVVEFFTRDHQWGLCPLCKGDRQPGPIPVAGRQGVWTL